MPGKYAPGTQAWGRCQRCSQKFLLRDLVFDGYMPGLRVCVDCYDPIHPQEFLQDTADPIALWQPSPEYGPAGPELTVTPNVINNVLNWTKADPRGGARIINYVVMRAVSYDQGVTFSPFTQIYDVVVQYDSFGLLLYDPDHTVDYQPYISPGTVIVDPYTYTDATIVTGATYQYYIAAYFTEHRYVPSNYVVASNNLVIEYLTSRPYPYDLSDALNTTWQMKNSQYTSELETANTVWAFEAGTVLSVVITYSNYPTETANAGFFWESGSVQTVLITYSNYPTETANTSFNFEAGTVVTGLVTYSNYPIEPANTAWAFTAGSVM